MGVAFDTLKFAQTLRDKAKLSPEQAEGISQAFAEASSEQLATKSDLGALATKADLFALAGKVEGIAAKLDGFANKSDLSALDAKVDRLAAKVDGCATKGELRESELRLEAKIESAKTDVIKWTFGIVGFQTVLMLGAVLALAKALH